MTSTKDTATSPGKLAWFTNAWKVYVPQAGESGGVTLEWIDTILGWLTWISLLLPNFPGENYNYWNDGKNATYPLPDIGASSADEDGDITISGSQLDLASLDAFKITRYLSWAGVLCFFLVAVSGYYCAYKLYDARISGSNTDAVKTIRSRRRFIPCVLGFIPNAGWGFVAYHVARYNNYKLGPALYTSLAGLAAAILWAVVRLVRRWNVSRRAKASSGQDSTDQEKGDKGTQEYYAPDGK